MTKPEKLARLVWIGYLIFSSPLTLFISAGVCISFGLLFIEEIGPEEELPLSGAHRFWVQTSAITFPIVWIWGAFGAHRCNQTKLRGLPFLANLLVVPGTLWLINQSTDKDDTSALWILIYSITILTLLITGFLTAVGSALYKTEADNQAAQNE